MRLGSKRGSAVLEAPEEMYASDGVRDLATSVSPEVGVREPAPAGSLYRGRGTDRIETDEEAYVPKRAQGGGVRLKVAMGLLKSTGGKILVGSVLLIVLGGVVVTVLGVRRYLMHDDRFAVATSSEIEILGNEHLTRAQILSVFGADLERNIFKVPLAERRADLERLPWVAHATVMRLLPNHLRIQVVERVPVAFARQGTELGLVDANGVLLDMPEQTAGHYSFPVLTGMNASDPLSTRAARMAVYAKLMKDLDSSGEKLSQKLSEVDVSNPEDVKALVTGEGPDVLVHFGDEKFLERFKLFEQHLPEWKAQYPKLASADMRYEQQVVLEMQAGSETPLSAAPVAPTNAAAAATPQPAPAHAPVAPPVVAARRPPALVRATHRVAPAKPNAHSAMAARIAAARAARVANTVPVGGGR
jgi:cell division protein FtsQ